MRSGNSCAGCGADPSEVHKPGCKLAPHSAEVARALGDTSHAEAKRMYREPADPALAETYWPEGRPPGIDLVDERETYTGDHMEQVVRAVDASPEASFCVDVLAEVRKARAKFGGQSSEVTGLALGEELNEVFLAVALGSRQPIKKLLHIREGKSGEDELYAECVQLAAMALRLATESADRAAWPGNAKRDSSLAMRAASIPGVTPSGYAVPKRGCGGSYEVGSGGHVPGTPGEGCPACDRDFGNKDTPPPRFARRAD